MGKQEAKNNLKTYVNFFPLNGLIISILVFLIGFFFLKSKITLPFIIYISLPFVIHFLVWLPLKIVQKKIKWTFHKDDGLKAEKRLLSRRLSTNPNSNASFELGFVDSLKHWNVFQCFFLLHFSVALRIVNDPNI